MRTETLRPFRPHPLLRNGHLQTLFCLLNRRRTNPFTATAGHEVPVSHGDSIYVHEDCPNGWQPGDPVTLLVHGLGGSHRSSYITRIACKLFIANVRTYRMDMRISGAAAGRSRKSYHAGLTDDLMAALALVRKESSRSPVTVIGFSLGGNLLLKMLGDLGGRATEYLDSAIAVCPPLDLGEAVKSLRGGLRRIYDRHFVRMLMRQLERNAERMGEPWSFQQMPVSLYDFDQKHTAPTWGFASAEEYYARSSCGPHLVNIECPTIILAARDDPMIPTHQYEQTPMSDRVQPVLTRHGGHVGFIAARGDDPDRHWMDWRIIEWVQSFHDAQAT